jgi:hypothetical protein
MRVSSLRELASGVDALYLSGHAQLPKALLADLKTGREYAREADVDVVFDALGEGFRIAPRALARYPYRLEHRFGVIGLTDSKKLPPVRIQPRSDFLHAAGPRAAVEWFRERLEPACGRVAFSVSRLDLYADFQGWSLTGDERHRFVSRGTARNTREESDVLTGFEFGRRKTKTVVARIYDKTTEARGKGLGHWPAVWADRFVAGERVLRVEYEFGKSGLVELGVTSVDEALTRAPQLWAYATEDWLSLRTPTADESRSRWPVDPDWTVIQHTKLRGNAHGAERIAASRRQSGVESILPGLRGYLSILAAYGNCQSLEDSLAMAGRLLGRDEQQSGIDFVGRVRAKRRELRLA